MKSRKIYKSGGSTYVMSIPKEWIKNFGIEEGDSIYLSKGDNSINMYTTSDGGTSRKVKINTSDMSSPYSLLRVLIAYYINGVSTIEIKFKEENRRRYRKVLKKIMKDLIGIELVEDLGNEVTLEIFIDYKRMTIPNVLEKMYNISGSMISDLNKSIQIEKKDTIKDIVKREEEIDKLYFLAIRQLKHANSFQAIQEEIGIKNPKDVLSFRILVKTLERISDHIEDIGRGYIEISNLGREIDISQEMFKLLKMLSDLLVKSRDIKYSNKAKEYDEVFLEIEKFDSKLEDVRLNLFDKLESPDMARGCTDIIISLSRIAHYIGDITEIEINMNVDKFKN